MIFKLYKINLPYEFVYSDI